MLEVISLIKYPPALDVGFRPRLVRRGPTGDLFPSFFFPVVLSFRDLEGFLSTECLVDGCTSSVP